MHHFLYERISSSLDFVSIFNLQLFGTHSYTHATHILMCFEINAIHFGGDKVFKCSDTIYQIIFLYFFPRDSCMYAFQVNKKKTSSSTAHSLVLRERNHYFSLPPNTLLIMGWRTKVHQYKMWFKTVLLKDQHLNKSECRQTPGYTINKIEQECIWI